MKPQHFLSVFFFTLVLITSCGKDDNPKPDPEPQNFDITLTIDEHPLSGILLSELNSNLTGDIIYTIASETAEDAFTIDGAFLLVGDRSAFDYETSDITSGIIVATNGTESETINVTVNLNDIDDIKAFLTGDSITAYENAVLGEWIKVTETEYNAIANNLKSVNRSGQRESVFNNGNPTFVGGADFTVAINNAPSVPAGDILFAFKYHCGLNNTEGANVKLSEISYQSNFVTIGENLPIHDFGFNHFILKGNYIPTEFVANLAMYESNTIGYRGVLGETYFFEQGDRSFASNLGAPNRAYLYQGLSSSLKQWD